MAGKKDVTAYKRPHKLKYGKWGLIFILPFFKMCIRDSSQRAASVRNADKIVVLDDGVIVGMGTHDTLIDSCEVYREIYESQYGKGAR